MSHDTRRVFVGGLSFATTSERLAEAFAQFGPVADAKVMRNGEDGRHRGFGFVRFAAKRSAMRALEARMLPLDGRTVEVKPVQARGAPVAPTAGPWSPPAAAAGGAATPAPPTGESAGGVGSGTRKLFAGGLHYDTDEAALRAHFAQFGAVVSAQVMYSRETNRSRGFGFVVFAGPAGVAAAMQRSMHEIDGKMVEVKPAVPKGSPALAAPGARRRGRGGAGRAAAAAAPHPAAAATHAAFPASLPAAFTAARAPALPPPLLRPPSSSSVDGGAGPVGTGGGRAGSVAASAASLLGAGSGEDSDASVPASWAAVLAGSVGEGGGLGGSLFSGADSVTASVVSSIFEEGPEGAPGEPLPPGGLGASAQTGTIPEHTVPDVGVPPLALALAGGELWGGGLSLTTPAPADTLSVHSLESGLGSASVISVSSHTAQRGRADSQVSTRSDSQASSVPPGPNPWAPGPGGGGGAGDATPQRAVSTSAVPGGPGQGATSAARFLLPQPGTPLSVRSEISVAPTRHLGAAPPAVGEAVPHPAPVAGALPPHGAFPGGVWPMPLPGVWPGTVHMPPGPAAVWPMHMLQPGPGGVPWMLPMPQPGAVPMPGPLPAGGPGPGAPQGMPMPVPAHLPPPPALPPAAGTGSGAP